MNVQLQQFLKSKNIAEDIDDKVLIKMGNDIIDWFDDDDETRSDWKTQVDNWTKLAVQVMERKTYPWPKSANVKYPLLTTAAMQFAARAYPALVPGPKLITGMVIGRDEGGKAQEAAERIGNHMSYQVLCEMDHWEEDMDRLCIILPIVGCIFKKTYYDPLKKKNVSELVLPYDLVIDYYAKSVETATRKSHVIYRTKNEVTERVRRGLYCDLTLGDPVEQDISKDDAKSKISGHKQPKRSPATPHKFIECHCNRDLDDDGYEEPYIVTVHYQTKQVVRIVARFNAEGIETAVIDGKEKVVKIDAEEYFTKFGFIPNPDGSIYDLGFGLLLGGINETVNTLTNQLLDAGTLNNLQSGFLGRGIRVRSGNSTFVPGEWKPVDFTGDDIKKHIFPLPTKEPSEVLFKLLEALVTSGKELASVAEIFVGKMPGQNTPATTTMATIEQGLKVFTAIHKRVYRSLQSEYEKLYKLNAENLPDETIYFTINEPQGPNSQSIEKQDYSNPVKVKPNADPNIVSSAQKLMKVQSYGTLLQLGTINPVEYTKRFLEAVEAENITALINQQPTPSPEAQQAQSDMKIQQMKAQSDTQLKQMDGAIKKQEADQKAQVLQLKASIDQRSADMDMRFKAFELQLKQKEAQMEEFKAAREHILGMRQQMDAHNLDMKKTADKHNLDMQVQREKGAEAIKQARAKTELAKSQPQGASK